MATDFTSMTSTLAATATVGPPNTGYNLTTSWDVAAQDTVEQVWFLFKLTVLAVIVLFVVFDLVRRHGAARKLYATRCEIYPKQSPPYPKGFFGWLGSTLSTPETFLLEQVGLDAVMLIRYLRICFLLCFLLSVLMLPILSGLNYYAYDPDSENHNSTTVRTNVSLADISAMGMTRFSIANVPNGSSLLWAHVVYAYLTTLIFFYFLYHTYEDYVRLSITARRDNETKLAESSLLPLKMQAPFLSKSKHARTIMCTNVPLHLRRDRRLAGYFNCLGIGPVDSAYVERIAGGKVLELIRLREKAVIELEHLYAVWIKNIQIYLETQSMDRSKRALFSLVKQALYSLQPQKAENALRMSHQVQSIISEDMEANSCTPEVLKLRPKLKQAQLKNVIASLSHARNHTALTTDAIDYYTDLIYEYTRQIVENRQAANRQPERGLLGTVAFVTFVHQSSAMIAAQVIVGDSYGDQDGKRRVTMKISFAPHPADVLWENLSISRMRSAMQSSISFVVFCVLCLFWTFPMSALASLANLSALAQLPAFSPFVTWLAQFPRLYKVTETTLPTLCVSLVTLIIPAVIRWLTHMEAYPAASWQEKNNLSKYFVFILFNVFFVFALSSAFWLVLSLIVTNPGSIIELLAVFIPHGSTFFVNYMLYNTMFSAFDLLRFQKLVPYLWKRWRCVTPRDWYQLHAFSSSFAYSFDYAYHLLILTITLCYSVIAPVIVFPAFLYFMVNFIVWRYHLLFVYTNPGESFGKLWIMVFNRCCFAMVLFHLTLLGLLTIKDATYQSVLVFFLLPVTGVFWRESTRNFERRATIVPLDKITAWYRGAAVRGENDVDGLAGSDRDEAHAADCDSALESSAASMSLSATNLSRIFFQHDDRDELAKLGGGAGVSSELDRASDDEDQEYYHMQLPVDYRNWSLTQKLMRVWLPAGMTLPRNRMAAGLDKPDDRVTVTVNNPLNTIEQSRMNGTIDDKGENSGQAETRPGLGATSSFALPYTGDVVNSEPNCDEQLGEGSNETFADPEAHSLR